MLLAVASYVGILTVLFAAHAVRPVKHGEPTRAQERRPRKVFHFLKEAGYGNMQTPLFWDEVDQQRGLLVVDVGGSNWSIPAVTRRGHTVIAFEPLAANAERFVQNARSHGLEAQRMTAPLPRWPVRGDAGHLFLFETCVSNASAYPRTVTLNEIVVDQDVHLLKIDTQGNELGVLQGAARLLGANRVNMVELDFWPREMASVGVSAVEVLNLLHGFGFVCFDSSRNQPTRPSDYEGFVASFDGARGELLCFNAAFEAAF